MKIIKIARSKYKGVWYEDLLGCSYEVRHEDPNGYWVQPLHYARGLSWVHKDDCFEILATKNEKFKINQEGTND